MYRSYSFINVANGKDEFDHRCSRKNMVEVAVVSEIVASLYKGSYCTKLVDALIYLIHCKDLKTGFYFFFLATEFRRTKKKVSIGVISPYKAQVYAIQKILTKSTGTSDTGFSVSVRSVDGFQGGEEDVIIISTVRCKWERVSWFFVKQAKSKCCTYTCKVLSIKFHCIVLTYKMHLRHDFCNMFHVGIAFG